MDSHALVDAVIARSSGRDSRIHGPTHWASVAAAGLTLLDATPEADPRTVLLFSLFHDFMRESDGRDPEHGARGARLAREMRDSGTFALDEDRLEILEEACISHDRGLTSTEPTIGVCWDADRLNLWRVGRKPDPALLSTPRARELTPRATRAFPGLQFDWPALFANFECARSRENAYLRFGDLPPEGRSAVPLLFWDKEPGVSAYPGKRLSDGSYALDFGRPLLGIDTRYLGSLLSQGRPLYALEGQQVGIGGMGEPLLADARIFEEVPPEQVDVLPDRERFKALIGAWRARREGRDLGPMAFRGELEPDERPMFPFAGGSGLSGFSEAVEESKRGYLRAWGLLDGYEEMQAKAAQDKEARRTQGTLRESLERTSATLPRGWNWKEGRWMQWEEGRWK